MSTTTPLILVLRDAQTGAGHMQKLTRELVHAFNRQDGLAAVLTEDVATSEEGKRGDALAIGSIVLQLVGSGGVLVSLVGVLKTWFERKPTLEIELQRPDGARFKLHAENLQAEQIEHIQQQLETYIAGRQWPTNASQS